MTSGRAPFGVGWTHAYDIRMVDENSGTVTDETMNLSDRADFFGARLTSDDMGAGWHIMVEWTHEPANEN
jgi:hypothetical protein